MFFYIDPFDPLIQANLSALKEISKVRESKYIEQSIYRFEVTFSDENKAEVESIINLIKYYPVSIPASIATSYGLEILKTVVETFLKTDIEGFEKKEGLYYPFLKSGEYVYRSPDEIFHLKKYLNQRKNNA
jgi:hypothetical protein